MTNPIKHFEKPQKLTFAQEQRQSLCVAASLASSPVLYLSAHRGVYSAEFEGHAKAFANALGGERTSFENGKFSTAVDLSHTDPNTLIQTLFDYCSFLMTPDNDERLIGSIDESSSTQAPLPGYIVNAIYLPPLDSEGTGQGPSISYAIDRGNFNHILPRLAAHLKEQGFLGNSQGKVLFASRRLGKPENT